MNYHFKCPECGYDDKEAGRLFAENERDCPLCFNDCFHLVNLDRWPENEAEPVACKTGENMKSADMYKAERDMLAEAIRDAAVKAGIVHEGASLTAPMLIMLCNDLAVMALSKPPK